MTIKGKEHSDVNLKVFHLLDASHPIILDSSKYSPQEYVFFVRDYYGFYACKIPSESPEGVTLDSILAKGNGFDQKFFEFCEEKIEDFLFTINNSNEIISTASSLELHKGK